MIKQINRIYIVIKHNIPAINSTSIKLIIFVVFVDTTREQHHHHHHPTNIYSHTKTRMYFVRQHEHIGKNRKQ